jgi:MYXO-CTERM domain-containing protein
VLYGAPFRFALGAETAPPGDQILLYDFDPAAPPRSLVVTVPGTEAKAEASLRVASPAKLSRVDTRELANCSFGSGAAGASSFLSSLALVLVVLRRRRQR